MRCQRVGVVIEVQILGVGEIHLEDVSGVGGGADVALKVELRDFFPAHPLKVIQGESTTHGLSVKIVLKKRKECGVKHYHKEKSNMSHLVDVECLTLVFASFLRVKVSDVGVGQPSTNVAANHIDHVGVVHQTHLHLCHLEHDILGHVRKGEEVSEVDLELFKDVVAQFQQGLCQQVGVTTHIDLRVVGE